MGYYNQLNQYLISGPVFAHQICKTFEPTRKPKQPFTETDMNVERADPSYTAWDNAIVAKSKGRGATHSEQTAAVSSRQGERPANPPVRESEKTFGGALTHANAHEHDTDPSQRGQDEESFGFWDFIDIINPLQHIPVVSTIYRDLTGDTISAPARIAGGMLYGGPLGFAASIGNAIVEETSGQDMGEIAMAMIFDDDTASEPPGTAVASRTSGAAEAPPAGTAERPVPTDVAARTNEPPVKADNAGAAAVSQMQANNAALQALLKDMGLSQPATASNQPATAPQGPAQNPLDTAQLASTSTGTPSPTQANRPEPAPEAAVVTSAAQNRSEAPAERKSIPIDPSRYINSRAASASAARTASTAAATERNAASLVADRLQAGSNEIVGQSKDQRSERAEIQSTFADRMLEGLERYQSMSQQRSALPDAGAGQTPGAI